MKVISNVPAFPPFHPLTIEITDEREAKVLWHILNNTGDLVEYKKKHFSPNTEGSEFHRTATKLWTDLNRAYHPLR